MHYVKICPNPNCTEPNDESVGRCAKCGELLGGVMPTLQEAEPATVDPEPPAAQVSDVTEPIPIPDVTSTPAPPTPDRAPGSQPAVRATTGIGNDFVTLEFIRGGRAFTIQPGQILGRDDGSDDAGRVNIPADAGVDVGYVSRWHCRFDRQGQNGEWTVTPLRPRDGGSRSELAKANPTYLGSQRLEAGQSYPVRDGDRLRLADVELRIRLD